MLSTELWGNYTVYLMLHCHHQKYSIPNATLSPPEWFCMKMGSIKSHFNVSLTMKTQDSVHKPHTNSNAVWQTMLFTHDQFSLKPCSENSHKLVPQLHFNTLTNYDKHTWSFPSLPTQNWPVPARWWLSHLYCQKIIFSHKWLSICDRNLSARSLDPILPTTTLPFQRMCTTRADLRD